MFSKFKSNLKKSMSKHLLGKEEEIDLSFMDDTLHRLLNISETECQQLSEIIPSTNLKALCKTAAPMFLSEPNCLHIEPPVKVVGDIHGQYFDLLRIFELAGHPPESTILFLGDYVDRGAYGIEVMALLLIYKIKYPDKIYLLRGNHECEITSKIYGFCDQCLTRYSYRLWERFCQVFEALPVAATIGEKFFCVHGGLSPMLQNIDQIREISRPCKVLDGSLLSDLVWSDPELSHTGWVSGKRGISGTFGLDMLQGFISKHSFDMIIRAHQVAQEGYEFFGDNKELVTLFSAPNYCGTRNNLGAVMTIASDTDYHFDVLTPNDQVSRASLDGTVFCDQANRINSGIEAGEQEDLPPPLISVDSGVLEHEIWKVAYGGGQSGSVSETDEEIHCEPTEAVWNPPHCSPAKPPEDATEDQSPLSEPVEPPLMNGAANQTERTLITLVGPEGEVVKESISFVSEKLSSATINDPGLPQEN
mmetsp:Transcript_29343/g.82757  ORF Transcript_29343/g.82757 Transcript_29343/m.82757 type:complete len:476 (-) Transcript_29343:509-1936(-)